MRKTLYLKFLLAYLIFGFFGFIVVATFGSSMTLEHMKEKKQIPYIRKRLSSPIPMHRICIITKLRWKR